MAAIALGVPTIRRADAGAPDLRGRPDVPGLVDRFGRVAHDLRVSITSACSLRCTYCMPAEGLPVIPRDELLTAEEIGRLVGIAVRDLGVLEVRFTGGEPLTRGDLVEIVRRSAEAAPGIPLSLTTNGIGLDKRAEALRDAGITRVNVSLDTLDREHFTRLTRRDRLPAVLAGIAGAHRAGIGPIKVNAVLMRETLADAPALLAWAIEHGCRLRFIEQMPLDADEAWRRDNMVDARELLAVLGTRFSLDPVGREDPAAPAEEWLVDGGPVTVGIIASVTRPFCGACDRTRLTAEGSVRSCLFGDDETDLRGLLRSGSGDDEIADLWRAAMWGKKAGHGIDDVDFVRPVRTMGGIGG
ncbi:GTP 3',8-cyclase MoaA [Agromyces marinus]|uniref:GTP 3',8-cyclase n=1 Tax=Agromyces marinus TaxID=1389020 RepID=A0ABM8H314_9MICO|nr:GTP 3',8-cyclase MoaA [Agromyces marinus]UIP59743.1 GTP 3',8-cyclase [Agromyces marinus]BDZ55178.1 cyclic pyranopterin monophosphate synthase [Agromyces marinus]